MIPYDEVTERNVEGSQPRWAAWRSMPAKCWISPFSAFTPLEGAGATPESVSLVRRLTSDEILGPAAGALLVTWRVKP